MKKQTGLLVIILIANLLSAQLITSIPAYPTQFDSIVIYFDATFCTGEFGNDNTSLKDYTGDIYAHTGVITENSSGWKYVIAGWNENIDKAKLINVRENLWKLNIGYIREYYVDHETDATIPLDEKVLKLAFVFRNSDGSKTGRDIGGADIFYDLFDPGITILVENPFVDLSFGDPLRSPVFASLTDTIQISGKAATINTEADSIKLFIGGQFLFGVNDSVLTYDFITSNFVCGPQEITLVGLDTAGITDTTSFVIMVNPPINGAALPEGIVDGINYNDDGSVTLSLFAPFKEFIYLIGDFNDWKVDENYFMKKYSPAEDSVVFWYEFENVNENQIYQYQYLIDGKLRIADPYTELILDSWNDRYIDEETFPDLPGYPYNKTNQIVSTFQKKSNEFPWTDNDFQKPDREKLVIYELLIRDFTDKHSYNGALEKLDYLDSLGINAIELLPINEFEGNSSWGYNTSFYFALDKYYGTPDDLRNFVNECHRRGIAVLGDMVLNHAYGSYSMVRMYMNETTWRPTSQSPWFNEVAPHTDFYWGYDFNHESKHTKYFIDRVNKYWIKEFHLDGYRFDFTRGFTNKSGGSGPYDANRINILKRMADEIWKEDSSAFVILEHLVDENSGEMKELADYGTLLWGNMNYSYSQASMGWNSNSDFSWGYYKNRGWTKPHLVTYMESHDEERLMYKNLQWGNSSGGYNVKDLATALNRIKLVSAFFYTLPGPKMIWQFGELGYDYSINYDGRLGEKPIRWDYLTEPARLNLYKTVKTLLKLRNENDVFTNPSTSVQLSLAGNDKRIALTGSMNVLIIGNFGVTNLNIAPNFQHGGRWYDYFTEDSINVQFTTDLIPLAPGEFHIYTDQKLETPEQDILSDIDNELPDLPEKFSLYPNYPNPFNAGTTFQYDLEKQSDIHFQIYDILGRQVYSQDQYDQPAGRYSFAWQGLDSDGRELQSGVYFFVIRRNDTEKIQKITLLK